MVQSFPEPKETENKDHHYYLNKTFNSSFYSNSRDALTKNKNLSDTYASNYWFKKLPKETIIDSKLI